MSGGGITLLSSNSATTPGREERALEISEDISASATVNPKGLTSEGD